MKLLSLLISSLFLLGCVGKPAPAYLTRTEYQKVYQPVKCIDRMPEKPEYVDTAESFKELMEYFSTVEDLLYKCSKEGDKNASK